MKVITQIMNNYLFGEYHLKIKNLAHMIDYDGI